MKRYTFTVGTGYDKNGSVISSNQALFATTTARAYLARTFGGYSEQPVSGGWIDDKGELVAEQSLRFVVVTDNYTKGIGEQAAHMLKELFNQSAVLMEKEEVAASFVSDAVEA